MLVSLWFVHDTGLTMMVEILKIMREEMESKFQGKWRTSEDKFGNNPPRNLWRERRRCSSKDSRKLEEMRRKSRPFFGEYSEFLVYYVGPQRQRHLAAKHTRENEGHADEGWQINEEVVSNVCTDFDDVLF